jgi:hypothetical protein
MTTEPRSPLSETEKRAAFLAELEAERARRVEAGKWSGAIRTILVAVPEAGETLRAAQQRAVYQHLAEHCDAPKNVSAYNWIVHEILDPPPAIELPGMQYAADHADAIDITPPPRPSMPPTAAPPLPIEPPRNRALEARLAEQRRMRRFMDDDWKPHDGPLRYPRGNRQGW